MKKIFSKTCSILALIAILASCKNEPDITPINPLAGLTKLKEGYAFGASAKVEIWGKKNLFMGYNSITVVLLDSLNLTDTIKDAHIHFMPEMTMGTGMMAMKHACPVENPKEEATNGVFPGAVAFIMPTSSDGAWTLDVMVHNHKYDKEGTASFAITVDNPTPSVMCVFTATSADTSKLVLSMVEPLAPNVGMNDIEFTLHRKESMMSWPADSTYTFVITPEMPSMGHGSPNNVNPVHVGNGHYKGKVNFTMTGEWKVNVAVQKDGNTISNNTFFTITF
ncbi:MAG: hypothetical protein AUK44_04610 [Porphyromonadaceae bacterium CG2_30_38_12]|nr:MAG: hypothetical protein AUK44_04610 [Porphyromonadaceae bacterium CG2_30_38_12]